MSWSDCPPALSTNQRRARRLRQVVARHLLATDDVLCDVAARPVRYHYTLHVRSDSPALYSSEPQLSDAAVWEPLHLESLLGTDGNADGLIVRVWASGGQKRAEILSWAVRLRGLVPVSLRWQFQPNTLLFRFGVLWMTAAECVAERGSAPAPPLQVSVPEDTVGRAADAARLERLHRCQRERRRLETVMEEAAEVGVQLWPGAERRRWAAVERDQLRRRLLLLRADTAARRAAVSEASARLAAARARQTAGQAQLQQQWQELRADTASLADWRARFAALHALYLQAHSQLAFRRRELCTELQLIYPLRRTGDAAGGLTIQGVHLPNAEEYSLSPDRSVSVALSHAAHLVVMVAWVLGVALRYAIIQRDAHPYIEDHIVPGLPSVERQFPLHVAGRDSLPFNYAVYLLNKDIAQLRQYCGLETHDLRAMLPNLASLLSDGVPAPEHTDSRGVTAGQPWPCGPPPTARRREQRLRLPPASVTLQDAVDDLTLVPPPPGDELGASPERDGVDQPGSSPGRGSVGEPGSSPGRGRVDQPGSSQGRGSVGEPRSSPGLGSYRNGTTASSDGGDSDVPEAEGSPPHSARDVDIDVQSLSDTAAPAANGGEDSDGAREKRTMAGGRPSLALYDNHGDDTDWAYVTSRMQILAKPKSFKLVTKRDPEEQ